MSGGRIRPESATRSALVALAAMMLMSCSPSTDPGPTGPTEPASSPAERVVSPGERVEIAVDEGDLLLVLDSVDVLASCPSRGAPTQEPQFEHFLVLEVTAALSSPTAGSDDGAASSPSYAPLGAEMFRVRSPDGEYQPITSTEESWACFENAELLPAFVDAGETVSGKVVLDVATRHGSVSYAPHVPSDWHWAF